MTLRQILNGLNRNIKHISFRTIAKFDGKEVDVFTGACRWLGDHLFSLDGDTYPLDIEVKKWNYDGEFMTVYYESGLIKGGN